MLVLRCYISRQIAYVINEFYFTATISQTEAELGLIQGGTTGRSKCPWTRFGHRYGTWTVVGGWTMAAVHEEGTC